MTYIMGDAINPANLPNGLDAYAGYENGNWPDFQQIAQQHPAAHLLDLTVFLANRGDGIDDEPGDATDAQTVPYVGERLAAKIWRPVIYASISRMANVISLQTAAGRKRSDYRLLSAHYGAGKHICGPNTCKLGPQCDGTQWIDHGGWDESLLADDFFNTNPEAVPLQFPPFGIALDGPITSILYHPGGGVAILTSVGSVYAPDSPYNGDVHGKTYWGNRTAAQLVLLEGNAGTNDSPWYQIVATTGEKYPTAPNSGGF